MGALGIGGVRGLAGKFPGFFLGSFWGFGEVVVDGCEGWRSGLGKSGRTSWRVLHFWRFVMTLWESSTEHCSSELDASFAPLEMSGSSPQSTKLSADLFGGGCGSRLAPLLTIKLFGPPEPTELVSAPELADPALAIDPSEPTGSPPKSAGWNSELASRES